MASVISKALKITGELESTEDIQIDGEIEAQEIPRPDRFAQQRKAALLRQRLAAAFPPLPLGLRRRAARRHILEAVGIDRRLARGSIDDLRAGADDRVDRDPADLDKFGAAGHNGVARRPAGINVIAIRGDAQRNLRRGG